MKYYDTAFTKLIEAGVPKWFIRLYAIDDLAYFSQIYFYRNVYDIETQDGWYTTNGIAITALPPDKNRKCYGGLQSAGFPPWEQYRLLFNGDEYDNAAEFMDAFDRHQEEWNQALEKHRATDYS
jgi:hypothetical protein